MATLEERVENLESLLRIVVTNTNVTRTIISDVLNRMNENSGKMETEIASLHAKVDKLSGNTDTGFDDVKLELSSIQDEISKINTVTNYDELVTNMKLVKGGQL